MNKIKRCLLTSTMLVVIMIAFLPLFVYAVQEIPNGGFETGDFTSWTHTGGSTVTTGSKHSGTYGCNVVSGSNISQTGLGPFAKTDIASFSLWHYDIGSVSGYALYVQIFYSDTSHSDLIVNFVGTVWTEYDLLAHVPTGKSVTGVNIKGNEPDNPVYVDDVYLNIAGDTTSPTSSAVTTHGRAIRLNASVVVTWSDETALANFTTSSNTTGSWANSTWTAISGLSYVCTGLVTLNNTIGNVVAVKQYANDTSNNMAVSSTAYITTAAKDMNFENNALSDFDSYTVTDGTNDNSPLVGTTYKHSGTYGANCSIWGTEKLSSVTYNRSMPPGNFDVYAWFYIPSIAINGYYDQLLQLSTGTSLGIMYNSGILYADIAGGLYSMGTYSTPNTWYKLELVEDDITAHTVQFMVNGIVKYTYSYGASPPVVNELRVGIQIGNAVDGMYVYIDDIWVAPLAANPPIASNMSVTNVSENVIATFSVNWFSTVGLDSYIFGCNTTGTFTNSTMHLHSLIGYNTATVTDTNLLTLFGDTITWEMWSNDTNDAWGDTDLQSFVIGLHYCDSYGVSPDIGGSITWNYNPNTVLYSHWTGTLALSGYYIVTAISGGFPAFPAGVVTTYPWQPFALSATTEWANFTGEWDYPESTYIAAHFYVNDSANHWNDQYVNAVLAPYGCIKYDSFEYGDNLVEHDKFPTQIYVHHTGIYAGITNVLSHGYNDLSYMLPDFCAMNTTFYEEEIAATGLPPHQPAYFREAYGEEGITTNVTVYDYDSWVYLYDIVSSNRVYIRFAFMLQSLPSIGYVKLADISTGLYPEPAEVSYASNWAAGLESLFVDPAGSIHVAYPYSNGYIVGWSIPTIISSVSLNTWYQVTFGFQNGGIVDQYHNNTYVQAWVGENLAFNSSANINWGGSGYIWFGAGDHESPFETHVCEDAEAIFYTVPLLWWGNNYVLSLTADLDNGNWIFADERYYSFKLNVTGYGVTVYDITTAQIFFTVPSYNGSVTCAFVYTVPDNWSLVMTPTFDDRNIWPARTEDGTIIYDNTTSSALFIFRVWVTVHVQDVYQTGLAVTMQASSLHVTSTSIAANFTRIYSHGGFSLDYHKTGDAGKISGGDALDFYANNNSDVYSEMVYHNLQHIKMLPQITALVGEQSYDIWYGVDYCNNSGVWFNELAVDIYAINITYENILGGGERDICYGLGWYQRGVYIRTDIIMMFHHGETAAVGELFDHRLWIDFWFNNINGSTTVGGRVNAYEYPMKDNAAPYLKWLSTNWGVRDDVQKDSMTMMSILSDTGAVMPVSQIRMMKIWNEVNVGAATTNQNVTVQKYEVMDLTFGQTPLVGIQTPIFDETKVPTMQQGGLLGFLSSTFSYVGKWLSDNILFGGLALWPTFVAFLDTIAGWMGFPHGFSNMIAWLGSAWTWFSSSIGWVISLFVPIFTLLGSVLGNFVIFLSDVATYWAQMIMYATNLLGNSYTSGINVWNDLGITQWIILGIILYPIYLIFIWDEYGIDAVMSQLTFIFGIVSGLASFFLSIIRTVITAISWVIESIPVVE